METIIVILIVGAAVIYSIRNFVKKPKGTDSCNGGCTCETTCESNGATCDALKK